MTLKEIHKIGFNLAKLELTMMRSYDIAMSLHQFVFL